MLDPWTSSVSFEGRLAAQVCAPNGVASCVGVRHGEHHDRHMVALERTPNSVSLELEWDATSTSSRELVLGLDGVLAKSTCEDCSSYRFRVLGKTQGASPLRLTVHELELWPGEGLSVFVRMPNELPQPVMAQARPAQPFVVEGTMRGT